MADTLVKRVQDLEYIIAHLPEDLDARFAGVKLRFAEVRETQALHTTRFSTIERRIDGLEGKFEGLETRVGEMQGELSAMRGEFSGMRGDLAAMKGELTTLSAQMVELLRRTPGP